MIARAVDRNSPVFPKVTVAIQLKVASIAAPISILMREHLPHISAGYVRPLLIRFSADYLLQSIDCVDGDR